MEQVIIKKRKDGREKREKTWNVSFQKYESVLQNTRKCETILSKNTKAFYKTQENVKRFFPKTQIFSKNTNIFQKKHKLCETVLSKNTNIFQKHKYFPKTQIMWNGSFQKHESVLQKIVKPITDIVGFT